MPSALAVFRLITSSTFSGLLDRQLGGLRALQYLDNVDGSAVHLIGSVSAIAQEPANGGTEKSASDIRNPENDALAVLIEARNRDQARHHRPIIRDQLVNEPSTIDTALSKTSKRY